MGASLHIVVWPFESDSSLITNNIKKIDKVKITTLDIYYDMDKD